ncbi:hypothetical protein N657DRAFT_680888 [Parathielavia appendiculata]|uniref:Uncharacterized protein n=1 Tax=Parathielavia appendiculata TaxID=2587402 RepID=A0AAN6U0V4_9PEZI|nr:hypothetical protein N657DRAFT_680888 [Parathielavia appendiculata]
MSADLFAAFGDVSQTQTSAPQQQNEQDQGTSGTLLATTAPAASDSFSFLSPSTSLPQPTQWPPLQQLTGGQAHAWLTSPIGEPLRNDASEQIKEDDEDGWGDFEVAPANPSPQPVASSTATSQPRARLTRASTIDMMTNKLVDLGLESSTPEPWQHRPSWERDATMAQTQKPARNPDPNVLFDADFEAESGAHDDEDFGDFETGTTAVTIPQAAPTASALDLLFLDSAPAGPKKPPPGLTLSNAALQAGPSYYPEAPKSPYGSFQERKPEPVKRLQVKPPTAVRNLKEANEASPSPVTAWPSVESEGFGNAWEEFRDLPDTNAAATELQPNGMGKPGATSDWEWQDWGATETRPASTSITTQPSPTTTPNSKPGPPPTNIPPPAILLSLFPSLLDLASSSLLKPLLTLPPSSPSYQRVLTSQSTLNFLQGYLALATVAARLITGRKHRWHRDKFLAQGMSISAAPSSAAGGQRGMKLASVDKSQAAHEDREAAEVAASWKRQVGRLRSVVAAVNQAQAHQGPAVKLRVPEVAVGLSVTTAKGVPTAPRACVVCGLKRDERVAKVDGEVDDFFGEWWVEFWGHRDCRNFWLGHERELRRR